MAAPGDLQKHGEPQTPQELMRHACICIRQGDDAAGLWRFSGQQVSGRHQTERLQSVKVAGRLNAVYAERHRTSVRVRALVDCVAATFRP